MHKLRYWFWILEAWFKRHWFQLSAGLLFFGAIVFCGFWFVRSQEQQLSKESVFIEGVVGRYVRTKLPPTVMSYISKGLVRINDKGEPIPEIAKSVEVSEDGKTYTIKLPTGIKWHDGKELISADLAYNIPDVIIEKPDNYTLVFKRNSVFAPFPTLLTSPLIRITSNNDFLGVGDYRIKGLAFKGTDYLTLLELESSTRLPKHITIKFYPTEQDAITALKLGQVHSIDITNSAPLINWRNSLIFPKVSKRSYTAVYFNMKDNLVGGKDPTLRHILSLATPVTTQTENYLGPFSIYSWAYTPYEAKYSFNFTKAQELFSKWLAQTKNTSPKITLSFRPGLSNQAQQIKDSWHKLGIDTTTTIHGQEQSFQTLLTTQDLPADPDQYSLWHSTQANTNLTNYNNPRVDLNLEEGRRTIDPQKRLEKYQDFARIILEDQPVVYLNHLTTYTIIIKKHDTPAVRELKGLTK